MYKYSWRLTPLSIIGRISRCKISRFIGDLNCHISFLNVYGIFYPTTAKYTYFHVLGIFNLIYILHAIKYTLINIKNIDLMQSVFSGYNETNLTMKVGNQTSITENYLENTRIFGIKKIHTSVGHRECLKKIE